MSTLKIIGHAESGRVSIDLIEGDITEGKVTYTHRIAISRRASDTPTLPFTLASLRMCKDAPNAWLLFLTMCEKMELKPTIDN